ADRRQQHLVRRDAEAKAECAIAIVGKEPVVARPEREARRDQHRLVSGATNLEEDLALVFELDFLVIQLPREEHRAVDAEEVVALQTLENFGFPAVQDRFHARPKYSIGPVGICSTTMSTQTVRLHRWD